MKISIIKISYINFWLPAEVKAIVSLFGNTIQKSISCKTDKRKILPNKVHKGKKIYFRSVGLLSSEWYYYIPISQQWYAVFPILD